MPAPILIGVPLVLVRQRDGYSGQDIVVPRCISPTLTPLPTVGVIAAAVITLATVLTMRETAGRPLRHLVSA